METIETFYGLPNCTTCQKAEAFLKDKGLTIEAIVNVKTHTVDKATLRHLAHQLGGVENLFSKRALKYRALGLHERTLTEDDMIDLMHQEYTFIKRPVVVTKSGKVLAGYTQKPYNDLVHRQA